MNELALHVMDILQNSIKAGSSIIYIAISVDDNNEFLEIEIKDNGCGMDGETLNNAVDPFYTSRTTRNVGLGLPLLKEAAFAAEGNFHIESKVGNGTVIRVSFKVECIDRQPLGDIGNIFFLTMLSYERLVLKLQLACGQHKFCFDSREFSHRLEKEWGEDFSSMDAAFRAEEKINEQLSAVFGGVLPELGGELREVKRNSQNRTG